MAKSSVRALALASALLLAGCAHGPYVVPADGTVPPTTCGTAGGCRPGTTTPDETVVGRRAQPPGTDPATLGASRIEWLADDGTWYRDRSTALVSHEAEPVVVARFDVGSSSNAGGALPIPGNYDGVGDDEPAVISVDGSWVTLGSAGTIPFPPPPALVEADMFSYRVVPVPGAYAGGATTLPAWYRPIDATWFIQGREPVQFGRGPSGPPESGSAPESMNAIDHDVPVPADYDGDGITDLAVYSPRSGWWRIRNSATGDETSHTLGGPGWLPVPGDYYGLHHAQIAVFNAFSNFPDPAGTWRIGGGTVPVSFGEGEDVARLVPAPADYDADGKVDIAYLANAYGSPSPGRTPADDGPVWHIRRAPPLEPMAVKMPRASRLSVVMAPPWLLVSIARLAWLHRGECASTPGSVPSC